MNTATNPWDEHAVAYGRLITLREQEDLERNPLIAAMLALLGDIAGRRVLDACCGEGFFSRVLAARGARVTGIDLSPRLIDMARAKDPHGTIDYRVGDLSRPMPEFEGHFGLIGSHLALNDVRDLHGFVATLASLASPKARVVLGFNNPYSAVVRGHITDYFESGALGLYGGLRDQGVTAHYYHRTLEDYLDAFLGAGFRLAKLVDVPIRRLPSLLHPDGIRFPSLMVLGLDRE